MFTSISKKNGGKVGADTLMRHRGILSEPSFRSGDRVIVDGKEGTIVNIFPDGIHMVRLDETGKVVATTADQLTRVRSGSAKPASKSALGDRHGRSAA